MSVAVSVVVSVFLQGCAQGFRHILDCIAMVLHSLCAQLERAQCFRHKLECKAMVAHSLCAQFGRAQGFRHKLECKAISAHRSHIQLWRAQGFRHKLECQATSLHSSECHFGINVLVAGQRALSRANAVEELLTGGNLDDGA